MLWRQGRSGRSRSSSKSTKNATASGISITSVPSPRRQQPKLQQKRPHPLSRGDSDSSEPYTVTEVIEIDDERSSLVGSGSPIRKLTDDGNDTLSGETCGTSMSRPFDEIGCFPLGDDGDESIPHENTELELQTPLDRSTSTDSDYHYGSWGQLVPNGPTTSTSKRASLSSIDTSNSSSSTLGSLRKQRDSSPSPSSPSGRDPASPFYTPLLSALPPRYKSRLSPKNRSRRKVDRSISTPINRTHTAPSSPLPLSPFMHDGRSADADQLRRLTVAQHRFPLDVMKRLYDDHRFHVGQRDDQTLLPWKPRSSTPVHPRLVSACGLVREVELIGYMPTSRWLLDPTMPPDVKDLLGGSPFCPLGHYRVAQVDIQDAARRSWPLLVIVNVGVPGMATGVYGGVYVREDGDGGGVATRNGHLLPPCSCLARITSLGSSDAGDDEYYDGDSSGSETSLDAEGTPLPEQPRTRIIAYPEPFTDEFSSKPSRRVGNDGAFEYANLRFVEEFSDDEERPDDTSSLESTVSANSDIFSPHKSSYRRRLGDAPTQLERLLALVVDYLVQPHGADWSTLPGPLLETRDRSTRLERKLQARRAHRDAMIPEPELFPTKKSSFSQSQRSLTSPKSSRSPLRNLTAKLKCIGGGSSPRNNSSHRRNIPLDF